MIPARQTIGYGAGLGGKTGQHEVGGALMGCCNRSRMRMRFLLLMLIVVVVQLLNSWGWVEQSWVVIGILWSVVFAAFGMHEWFEARMGRREVGSKPEIR